MKLKKVLLCLVVSSTIATGTLGPCNVWGTETVLAEEKSGYNVNSEIITSPDKEYEAENDPLYKKFNGKESVYDESALRIASSLGSGLTHDSRFKDCKKIYGIDVSKWNGNIDWKKVKKAGVDYAIIRVGYRGSANGSLVKDVKFDYNIQQAHNVGIEVGVYFFTQAKNENEAKEEANFTAKCLEKYSNYMSYPAFIDIEDLSGGRMEKAKLSRNQKTSICQAYCKQIEKLGYRGGVYANKSWMENQLYMNNLSDYCIWLARYSNRAGYSGKYQMWQFSSTKKVNGIGGSCDVNVHYRPEISEEPLGVTQINAYNDSLEMEWKPVSAADGYKVYLKDSKGNTIYSAGVTENKILIPNLRTSSSYEFKVRAYYIGTGEKRVYGKCTKSKTVYTAPAKIVNVSAKGKTSGSISISYNKIKSATSYGIYRKVDNSDKYEYIGSTKDTTYVAEGLEPSKKYSFKVRAVTRLNDTTKILGEYSDVVEAYTKLLPVKNLKVSNITGSSFELSWDSEDVSNYEIIGYSENGKEISRKRTNANNYFVSKLKPGTVQTYKVRNVKKNEDGKMMYSNFSDVKIITTPSKAKGLKATGSSSASVSLKWNKVSNVSGYRIYSCNKSSGSKKLLGNTSKTTFTVKNLKSSTKYYFVIKSYKKSGSVKAFGDYSSVVSKITTPQKVTGIKIKKSKTMAKLSWTKQSRVTGYKIKLYNSKGKNIKNYKVRSNVYTIKKLKKNYKYSVKIIAYLKNSSNMIYGYSSNKYTFKTKGNE